MKKAIILIFLLFLITEFTFAHDGELHKYIVYRAYQLLEKRYVEAGGNPQDLQEMRSKVLNTDGTQCNEDNDPNHPIVRGARQEDETDPIYGFEGVALVTSTHFWKADDGDSKLNWLNLTPNAYMKSKAYLFSNVKNYTWVVYIEKNIGIVRIAIPYIYSIKTSLIDFYNTGICVRAPIYGVEIPPYIISEVTTYPDYKRVSYEILGRAAHLLADMSVPAHAHIDLHIPILNPDTYEQDYMKDHGKEISTTDDNLINDDGFMPFLVNNYTDATIMKTLYYTMNQLSSHFPSNDVGGNNIVNNHTVLIDQKFNAWGTPISFQSTEMEDIAKKTFNFCIGETATLFYWFGIRTGMFQTQIKDMNFNCAIPNPTLTIHTDNSITLLPGFEFMGTDMLLTTVPKSSTNGISYIPPVPDYAPNTTIVLDSIPQNLPVDTIYVNE